MHNYNFLCSVSYNGKLFSGWVKQKNARTIQGEIEKAIKTVIKSEDFKTIGASKTDAGVHALDQKVLIALNFMPNLEGFLKSLNSFLRPDINIKSMIEVDNEFRIRNCIYKVYDYHINLGSYNLFSNDFEWKISNQFSLEKYRKAINCFVGEHDFYNFSGLNEKEKVDIKTIRKIDEISVNVVDNKLITTFKAKGFIRYQIRKIVGSAVAYATGKVKELTTITETLNLKNDKLKYIANPEGLILVKIKMK